MNKVSVSWLAIGVVVLLSACSKHEGGAMPGAVSPANPSAQALSPAQVPVQSSPASAVLMVTDAWARATVEQQMATGAFMKIQAKSSGALVGASSTVAEVTEIHEMKMDGEIMKMRPVEQLPIDTGGTVELAPGGLHVMLMGLRQPVKAGEPIEVKLQFKGSDGQVTEVPVSVIPRDLAAKANPHAHH